MENMECLLVNTNFFKSFVLQMEKYYGIKYRQQDIEDIANKIYSNAIYGTFEEMPDYFNMVYKGKIVHGQLGNVNMGILLSLRHTVDEDEFTIENWRDCLIPFSAGLGYCESDGVIYIGVDNDVAEFLNKYKAGRILFDIVSGKMSIPTPIGNTIKVYDMYIKKERSITAKKYVLANNIQLNKRLSTDNPYWALHYIESLVVEQETRSVNADASILISKKARYYNISESDLLHRYCIGMSLEDAIAKGLEEYKEYGLAYNSKQSNDNFVNYIRYLISKEKD